ncbi:hypothetical protein [Glutamicibacter protophormiae]|uniref:hypothetical protein n=1 Tax=Glutamicibacter protophormiae TaxID=37930 RepID=UPI00195C1C19|nr:hypothetical protein [Glutamicibacter protophormiae]QRQ79160.1 hypothetical protein JQN66_02585 [Glutamicibacter protophormiae]
MSSTLEHRKLNLNDTESGNNPDIFHLYCADPDRALCGEDLSKVEETDGSNEQDCVVCEDLDTTHECESCGL